MTRSRNLLAPVALALSALALGATTGLAHEQRYNIFNMSGANEAPNPINSLGTGSGLVTVDTDLFTMRLQGQFSGLTGNVTNSHIHCCTAVPGVSTAGVATPTPSFPGFPSGGTFGSYDRTFDMTLASSYNAAFITANGGTPGTAFSALLAGFDSGRAYWNIHSSFAAGGEIRAFLTPVPEPSSVAVLALSGVGLLAYRRRTRRTM